jgi:hypothetical protein
MRLITLGLALFGLPVLTSGDPLSPASQGKSERLARASVQRAVSPAFTPTLAIKPTEGAQTPSKHRDDEDGAVILELRVPGQAESASQLRRLHCRGHAFPATVSLAPPTE